MNCPRCSSPLGENDNFCTRCGMQLFSPPPVKHSPLKNGLHAFLRALFYYFLFNGVQFAVMFVYGFALIFSVGPYHTEEELLEIIFSHTMENIHIILILSALLTVLVLALSFRIRKMDALEQTHLRPIERRAVLPSLLLGASLQIVSLFTILLIPFPQKMIDSYNESTGLITGGPLWLELISVVLVTPVLEELIFRGLVFSRLRRGMSLWLSVVLSAVIFGWAHGHLISFLYAGALGICLALLMKRQNDSILAPILTHAGFNGTSYLLGLLPENINALLFFSLYFAAIAVTLICAFILFRKKDNAAPAHEAEA